MQDVSYAATGVIAGLGAPGDVLARDAITEMLRRGEPMSRDGRADAGARPRESGSARARPSAHRTTADQRPALRNALSRRSRARLSSAG